MSGAEIPPVLPRCPYCGAHLQPQMTRCWLCYAAVAGAETIDGEAPVAVELARPPAFSVMSEWIFKGLSAVVGLLLFMIIAGAFLEEPAAGITLTVLVSIPLGATALRLYLQKQRYGAVSWAERLATFLVSTALLFALLGVLCVAAFIALFVWCLTQSPGGWH